MERFRPGQYVAFYTRRGARGPIEHIGTTHLIALAAVAYSLEYQTQTDPDRPNIMSELRVRRSLAETVALEAKAGREQIEVAQTIGRRIASLRAKTYPPSKIVPEEQIPQFATALAGHQPANLSSLSFTVFAPFSYIV